MTNEAARAVLESHAECWEGEFDATCKVLANVKDGTRDYKPDPKSRTAFELAAHIVVVDIWFIDGIINGAFHYEAEAVKAAESRFSNVSEIVEFYKATFPAKMAELKALPAEKLTRIVDFFGMMQKPAVKFLGFATNHSIHHRGQLAAYLRAMGSTVPAIYGASADEPMVAS